MATVEIELSGAGNQSFLFAPIHDNLRGRVVCDRRMAKPKRDALERLGITECPGQIVGVDGDTRYVREPLHGAEHRQLRETIETRLGRRLPDERQEYQTYDINVWLSEMKRLVDSGKAVIVAGKLPANVDVERPRYFINRPRSEGAESVLAAAIDRQTAAIEKLVTTLVRPGKGE